MMKLPDSIARLIGEEPYSLDQIGLSGSSVLLFRDKVLKIQPIGEETLREIKILTWLEGRLPAPKLLAQEELDGSSYLLMTRLPGQMACTEQYLRDSKALSSLLAEGLQLLWQTDIQGCPVNWCLDEKLLQAQLRIERNQIDLQNVEAETFGPGGFQSPEALLRWLMDNRPNEHPVLSHGDYCLPNILFLNGKLSGFLDLGRCGLADRWCDIAIGYRSLRDNLQGQYASVPCPDYQKTLFFDALGIVPDWDMIRYYLLLDELF